MIDAYSQIVKPVGLLTSASVKNAQEVSSSLIEAIQYVETFLNILQAKPVTSLELIFMIKSIKASLLSAQTKCLVQHDEMNCQLRNFRLFGNIAESLIKKDTSSPTQVFELAQQKTTSKIEEQDIKTKFSRIKIASKKSESVCKPLGK